MITFNVSLNPAQFDKFLSLMHEAYPEFRQPINGLMSSKVQIAKGENRVIIKPLAGYELPHDAEETATRLLIEAHQVKTTGEQDLLYTLPPIKRKAQATVHHRREVMVVTAV